MLKLLQTRLVHRNNQVILDKVRSPVLTATARRLLFIIVLLGVSSVASAAKFNQEELKSFIDEMSLEHNMKRPELEKLFTKVKVLNKVLEAIAKPAESKKWYEYRKIFITDSRIKKGVTFWRDNSELLLEIENEYGVDREIIVAIIGVETFYGRHTGNYRVIDSLATLAFNYPPRAKFFRKELKAFLLMTNEFSIDPLTPRGSYAGAMGMPQFIASSIQNYAIDQDKDGRIDLWENKADVFASVANYFKRHGWEPGKPVVVPATIKKRTPEIEAFIGEGVLASVPFEKLTAMNIDVRAEIEGNPFTSLLAYRMRNSEKYWVGFDNFYVITRYNHSKLYGMAVYQLAQQIRKAYIAATEK